jgi:catechol 2,3-dioxygenase-like lactoylglutathione lyase family enzyme
MSDAQKSSAKFDVGGVLLDRPFQIRRLGHFGIFTNRMEEAKRFYLDLLGFQIADPVDLAPRAKTPGQLDGMGDTNVYFTRYGTDHHSFVLFPRAVFESVGVKYPPRVTVNQITWQVSSLKEVVDANAWLNDNKIQTHRSGRDTPGSNWHSYMRDPDGNTNELYYGIEQIGWDGHSKPPAMYERGFSQTPPLPQIAEYQEVDDFTARGVAMGSGYRHRETLPFDYEVGGIKMPRPFKITGIGPVRLFVSDMGKSLDFYTRYLGFNVTEEVVWRGHRCVFLRAATEHHSVALYPDAVREALDIPHRSFLMSFGLRVNDYRQLRDAVGFLRNKSVQIRYLPPELLPGMDYTAFALDPDGHLIQLYSYMEQVGWDGQPRPAAQRRRVDNTAWPDAIAPLPDSFGGEPFLGPWA